MKQWRVFVDEVGLSKATLLAASARRREQWAVRYQVWLMLRGHRPADAAQLVYNTSAALRGEGLGSLLEMGTPKRQSRIAAVKKGIQKRREALESVSASIFTKTLVEELVRPLTDWELREVCNWWLTQSGERPAVARRWAAILTVAYYACWRPSQYTKPTRPSIPWKEWLVRRRDVVRGEAGVGWIVRDQKSKNSYQQFYFVNGPAQDLVAAVNVLLEDEAEAASRGQKWLCWLSSPVRPVGYAELLERWGDGVRGARLKKGVEGPYALRRGGATFWTLQGMSWEEVGAANGWKSAQVRRYIMPKRWLKPPPLQAATATGRAGGTATSKGAVPFGAVAGVV